MSDDAGSPARTSIWILSQMYNQLVQLCDTDYQLFNPVMYPAPVSICQLFVCGTIGTRLPNAAAWKTTHDKDIVMNHILNMISNPNKVKKENIAKVDSNFRALLHQSQLMIKNDMSILREPLGSLEQ